MDIFDEDLLSFWQYLNENSVQYIMVGGFAVNMNGFIRATKDCDIWIKDTAENRKNFRKAFKEAGYGDYEMLETLHFAPGWTQFYIGNGMALDIMTSLKGLGSFDEYYPLAHIADLNGIRVPFLHINGLIQNKQAVARPKDLLDIIELEKIKKYLDEKNNSR